MRSYIAGFFDGEGTINNSSGNRYRITIPQTNKEVLERIKDYFGFGSIYETKKKKEHHKDAWVYSVTNNSDTLRFLTEISEDLIVKKEAVENAIVKLTMLGEGKELQLKKLENDRLKVTELKESGMSYRQIEKIIGFSRQKVCRLLKI
jgi:intein-encoded DNA endonuclease-like protein